MLQLTKLLERGAVCPLCLYLGRSTKYWKGLESCRGKYTLLRQRNGKAPFVCVTLFKRHTRQAASI